MTSAANELIHHYYIFCDPRLTMSLFAHAKEQCTLERNEFHERIKIHDQSLISAQFFSRQGLINTTKAQTPN